jgi:hypothetical protein
VNGLASDLAMSIVDSGHMYAMGLASSSLTPSARLGEILGGLNQVLYFRVSFAYDISILVLKSYAFVRIYSEFSFTVPNSANFL